MMERYFSFSVMVLSNCVDDFWPLDVPIDWEQAQLVMRVDQRKQE